VQLVDQLAHAALVVSELGAVGSDERGYSVHERGLSFNRFDAQGAASPCAREIYPARAFA
jgi:hypothetical protein